MKRYIKSSHEYEDTPDYTYAETINLTNVIFDYGDTWDIIDTDGDNIYPIYDGSVEIASESDVKEDILDLLEYNYRLLPEAHGVYQMSADIEMIYNVSGLLEYSYGVDEPDMMGDYVTDTVTEINADYTDIKFDKRLSKIHNITFELK